jgi:DNA-binding LacI/PurR family transcriptional regulator
MIRLKDIAGQAGVSVMTVSKVLRDAPDISTATKTRVRLIATQLGYVPDSNAQSLRTRTTRLLGVIVSSVSNPIVSRVLLAIEERAHELGYEIILAQTQNLEEREAVCIQRLLSRRVDGLFLSPVYRMRPDAPIYKILQARGVPVVLLGHTAPFCRQFANVETDDITASQTLTRHLLDLGHRQIAFFAGPQSAPWSQERFEGYRRALRDAGLTVQDQLIFQAGSTIEDGEKAALQFVNESTPATAIQAANDLIAIGCANTFLDQGVSIPGRLSVTGFGNILTAEHYRVPLTTIRQPKYRLGLAAVETMIALLRRQQPKPKRLAGEIIIRSSTAPPPAAEPAGTAPPADS